MDLEVVNLTEKAQEMVRSIKTSENAGEDMVLRLAVIGGGCSGLSYKISFDKPKDKDYNQNFSGFQVAIDPKSAIYLKGMTVDYKDGLNGKGFVFENPNAKNTCGCGESFSV